MFIIFPPLTIFHYIYCSFQNNFVPQFISTIILSLHGQFHIFFVTVFETSKCVVQTCQTSHILKNCIMSQNKIRMCLYSCNFLVTGNNENFSLACSLLFMKICMLTAIKQRKSSNCNKYLVLKICWKTHCA